MDRKNDGTRGKKWRRRRRSEIEMRRGKIWFETRTHLYDGKRLSYRRTQSETNEQQQQQRNIYYNDDEIHTYGMANAKLLSYLCFKRTQSIRLLFAVAAVSMSIYYVRVEFFFLFYCLTLHIVDNVIHIIIIISITVAINLDRCMSNAVRSRRMRNNTTPI